MTYEQYVAKYSKWKNTLVINTYDDRVSLLMYFEEDEDDIYFITKSTEGGILNCSAVGRFIPLKGFIPDDDYESMVHVFNLNNTEKAI